MVSRPEDQRTTCTSSDGTTLAVDTRGSGPGLVVLSGAVVPPGGYDKLISAFAGSFTVHYLHRRGRGASGPQGSPYRINRECEDLQAVLAATGARAVFGHSFGGLLALRAALQDTDGHIARLVAYDPAVSIDGSQPRDYLPAFTQAVARGRHARALTLLQRSLQVGGALDRLPAPAGRAVNWALLATLGRPIRATLPTVPAEASEAIRLDGPAEDYAAITAPTLVMIGERAPAWLRDGGIAVAAHLPHGQLSVMTGLDHNGPLLTPDPVATASTAFLLDRAERAA
jgi:pimeloyl-ACP methyl ester carboxylesterase